VDVPRFILRILVLVLFVAGLVGAPLALSPPALATGTPVTDFEAFAPGDLNGQDGWSSGHGSSFCPVYDVAVVPYTYGYPSFGSQSLRISNAITCGSYNDQTFSASLANEAGETSADTSSYSSGSRQPYFEAQWDFASTVPGAEQPNLSVVASADRGDPARMTWLQMTDTPTGLALNFEDYQHSLMNFAVTPIATGLDRTVPHTVKMTIHFVDGPANDVVQIYLDGALIYTGTTWEDYYRDWAGPVPHAVDSVMFRVAGTAAPATSGKGFLIDNFSSYTGAAPTADLAGLSLATGTLSPAFDPSTTAYSVNVGNDTTSLGVTASAGTGATAVVNGDTNLAVGDNMVTITVTTDDGATSKTYTLTVTRSAAPVAPQSSSSSSSPAAPAPAAPAVPSTPAAPAPVTTQPSTKGAAPLVIRISAARRVPLAVRHAFTPRILTTAAGTATISLTKFKNVRVTYVTWSRTLKAGANYLTLRIPAHLKIKLPGVYRLTVRVRAGGQSKLYSVPLRLSSRTLTVPLPKREADVLLVSAPSMSAALVRQLSAHYLVKTVDTDSVFTKTSAPNERVGTVVLDTSAAGLSTIRHLHAVFPSLHIVALVSSAAAGKVARAAGASMTVVKPASAAQLSARLSRALRSTLGR
jgi:CheY-like chemotaxis protein